MGLPPRPHSRGIIELGFRTQGCLKSRYLFLKSQSLLASVVHLLLPQRYMHQERVTACIGRGLLNLLQKVVGCPGALDTPHFLPPPSTLFSCFASPRFASAKPELERVPDYQGSPREKSGHLSGILQELQGSDAPESGRNWETQQHLRLSFSF